MTAHKHKEHSEGTHLGVDAWAETESVEETKDGYVPAARILAGEEPLDSEEK